MSEHVRMGLKVTDDHSIINAQLSVFQYFDFFRPLVTQTHALVNNCSKAVKFIGDFRILACSLQ